MRRISYAILVAACCAAVGSTTASAEQFHDHGSNPNPVLFQKDASPYGKSMPILLEVSLDGQPLNDVLSYRFASDDLFYLTGNLSLVPVLDGCITGSRQPAVVDGFVMMFKPLERGAHTIRVHGTDIRGADKTYTYSLNVE